MSITARSLFLVIFVCLAGSGVIASAKAPPSGPTYGPDGRLALPAHYREWVYLSSGFDMSYRPGAGMDDHHMFDNVFVEPHAYAAFRRTGHWPDGTMLVLEGRAAQQHGSINKTGHFQTDVMGIEVHVLDRARFNGGWAFFTFDPAALAGSFLPHAAACYACHSAHGAVDTTFVQFYPTLVPLARQFGTFRGTEGTATAP